MRGIILAAITGVLLLTCSIFGLEPGHTEAGGKLWFRYEYETSDGETEHSGFRIARGYVVLSHQFTERIGSKFNLDIFSSDKTADPCGAGLKIKAAYLDYGFGKEMKVYAGVIKNYFGTVYDWNYITIEKALEDVEHVAASADAGIALTGDFPRDWGEYQIGIYNGEGYKCYLSNIDQNMTYQGNLRLSPLGWITIGGSSRFARYDNPADTTEAPEKLNQLDLAGIINAHYGPVELWGEYLMTKLDDNTASGLMIMPVVSAFDRLQFVFRYDLWDPSTDRDDDGHSRIIAGANYRLNANANTQIQLNWNRVQPESDLSKPTDTIELQLRWKFSSNPF